MKILRFDNAKFNEIMRAPEYNVQLKDSLGQAISVLATAQVIVEDKPDEEPDKPETI